MRIRSAALAALVTGFFYLNAYSAEPQGEYSFFSGLSRAVKLEPEIASISPSPERVGTDLTGDFNLTWDRAALAPKDTELTELRKHKVLLVRGFMTGGYVQPFNFLGKKVSVGGYFNDQIKVLESLGVEHEMVDIDSVMTPAHNAQKVAREIAASDKPVIIISHSDGGMYTLEALVENKDLLPKVRGFISLQSPFGGSPVADYIKEHGPLLAAMNKLLGHFGGSADSLSSLSVGERTKFRDSNREPIRKIVSGVKIISLASWKDNEKHKLDTLLGIPRDFMLKRGIPNDGLVPVESAVLPGTDYVKIPGVDHIVTVMSNDSVLKYDRARLTKTLLLMIISR